MKTNILKAVLWGAMTLPVFTACEMDQFPSDSIPNEESWQVFQDATNFHQGLYAYLRSLGPSAWNVSDIQMDYFQPGKGYGNRKGVVYRWEFESTDDDMENVWSTAYSSITNCNNFINNYKSILASTSEDEASVIEEYAGDAYFIRAYAYYELATRFCKDYNAATAQTDLGLPIMTTVDINARPARSTMQETWDFIKADLDSAAAKIKEDEPSVNISLPIVTAMKARVALQMDNYADAVKYAKELTENDYYALASDSASFANLWINDKGDEIIFAPAENNQERHTWQADYLAYNTSQNAFSPDWIPSKATYDMYAEGDLRKSQWFLEAEKVIESDVTSEQGVKLFAKYPGNPALLRAGETTLTVRANAPKMIRLAEMYLILAEANKMLGNDTEARNYLNALLASRGAQLVEGNNVDLMAAIKLEWKKEFIGEGMRQICLKRWAEGYQRNSTAQDASIIVMTNPELSVAANIAASNIRWVWEIPQNETTTNTNIVPNW